jgi:hypothetical protein
LVSYFEGATCVRVAENRVLRKISEPKRDEVKAEWRRLHYEELYDVEFSPNIIRVIKSRRVRWAEHVARVEDRGVAYRDLVGRPEGRRPCGKPRRRWKDNIKKNIQEAGSGGMGWIDVAQDRDRWGTLANTLMNRVP